MGPCRGIFPKAHSRHESISVQQDGKISEMLWFRSPDLSIQSKPKLTKLKHVSKRSGCWCNDLKKSDEEKKEVQEDEFLTVESKSKSLKNQQKK